MFSLLHWVFEKIWIVAVALGLVICFAALLCLMVIALRAAGVNLDPPPPAP